MTFSSATPSDGGMMEGYHGMMGGYHGMMQGYGFGGWFYAIVAICLISGNIILIGVIMVYTQPSKVSIWGC